MFQDCLIKVVSENTSNNSTSNKLINKSRPFFRSQVHNFVGAAVRKANIQKDLLSPKKYQQTKEQLKEHKDAVLQMEYFKHDVTKEVKPEYKEFYPDEIKFRNQGGLYLIAKEFFPWAMDLLKFIANGYSQQQFTKSSNDYIAMNPERLRNDESILNQFKQTLAALGVAVDAKIVEAIHL
jgi:hypothetical protein